MLGTGYLLNKRTDSIYPTALSNFIFSSLTRLLRKKDHLETKLDFLFLLNLPSSNQSFCSHCCGISLILNSGNGKALLSTTSVLSPSACDNLGHSNHEKNTGSRHLAQQLRSPHPSYCSWLWLPTSNRVLTTWRPGLCCSISSVLTIGGTHRINQQLGADLQTHTLKQNKSTSKSNDHLI